MSLRGLIPTVTGQLSKNSKQDILDIHNGMAFRQKENSRGDAERKSAIFEKSNEVLYHYFYMNLPCDRFKLFQFFEAG